jgi:RES domain-containing protein
MVTAWRIVKTKHAADAFSGEGARITGGRWNSKGNRIVYISEHYSLAVLEMLVNLDQTSILSAYSVCAVHFDESLVIRLDRSLLPANWRVSPIPPETRRIGDDWIASMSSLILEVPSAVVEVESNYLINPQHPDFNKLVIDTPQPFAFDPRLTS